MPRIFYKQVELCQELPFEVRIPNAETLAAIHEIEHHPERLRRYRNVEEMFDAWEADEAECCPPGNESFPVRSETHEAPRQRRAEAANDFVRLLVHEQPLAPQHRDHPLVGDWLGYRDCHIEPDWLLIYKIDREEATLTLAGTGTHSDLFEN